MTQPAQIEWLDVADADALDRQKTITSGHSYFPVYEIARDHVLGIASVQAHEKIRQFHESHRSQKDEQRPDEHEGGE